MNKYFDQLGEKLRINYHIIEIIIFGDTVKGTKFIYFSPLNSNERSSHILAIMAQATGEGLWSY
jgi:hypothetical protein